MKSLVVALGLFIGLSASSQEETYVTIDTKGHMALVKNIMFSPDGTLLYSISDDKTIRVWNAEKGVLIKTFRGYIQDNHIGMLNSGAISPKGGLIAVGGYLGENDKMGDIRIHDSYTGEQLAMLTGNKSTVVALQFSPDGNYVFSGANDGTVGIFNVNNQAGLQWTGHGDGVYGLAVSPDGKWLLSTGYDKKAVLWNIDIILDKSELDYVELDAKHSGEIRNCAWSPKGKHFVTVGFDNKILLWSSKGEFIKEIDHIIDPQYGENYGVGDINCVAFSADGSKIVVGTTLSNNENAIVYSIPEGEKLLAFKEHDNAVISCAWYGESTIATAGGNDRQIYIWNADTGEKISTLKGEGKRMWKVGGGKGYQLAFGQVTDGTQRLNEFGQLSGAFDLATMEMIPNPDLSTFSSEVEKNSKYTLDYSNREPGIVRISNDSIIKFDTQIDGGLRCMSLTPDNNVVIGCSYRTLLYDINGKQLREFKGHSAEVYSVAFSEDGRFLYTASGDQTVKIWDLKDPGKLHMTYEEYLSSVIDMYGKETIDKIPEEKLRGLYKGSMDYMEVQALASLFVTADNEWICWTGDNYYATSQKGSRSVGFHVNQSDTLAAKYYAFEQFDVKYNRPDKVLNTLQTDQGGLEDMFKKAYTKRLQKLGMDEGSLADDIAAPELKLNTVSKTVTSPKISLSFTMTDPDVVLDRVFITNNEVPTNGKEGMSFLAIDSMHVVVYSLSEYLIPGENRIQMWCTNVNGVRSQRETVNIYYQTDDQPKPDLYILGIGASQYENDKMNLNYASKDIDDFVDFYSKDNVMYDSIHSKKLLNEEITLENIKAGFTELLKSEITDHVLIYIAGHGVLDANFDYFLATHDMNFNKPAEKGFAYTLLEEWIDKVPARTKTIFMDACHSGELDKDEVEFTDAEVADAGDLTFRSVGSKVKSTSGAGYENSFHLMKNIFTDLRQSSGSTVIASAGGAEYALEGDQWSNGVFTFALIDGLKSGEADLNNDGDIMLSEVQKFLRAKVSSLTEGRQKPISRYENVSNDYVFWRVK